MTKILDEFGKLKKTLKEKKIEFLIHEPKGGIIGFIDIPQGGGRYPICITREPDKLLAVFCKFQMERRIAHLTAEQVFEIVTNILKESES